MRRTSFCMAAALAGLTLPGGAHALSGTAMFSGAGWRPEKGLHLINMESGVRTVIATEGYDVGKFSPDGRRIYAVMSGTLYEMYNDGTNRRTVCTGVSLVYNASTNLCITDAGAFWLSSGGNINRCIIATGAKSVVATITGDYYQGLWMSTSGRRGMAWIRNNSTDHFYPFFEFPANFSAPTVKWADIWGHGHCISQDGQTVVINDWQRRCNTTAMCTDYGDHRTFHVYNFDQINVVWTAGFVKSFPTGDPTGQTGTADLHACVNNSDYLFYDAGGCRWPPTDIGGCDTCQRAWVTNWRTEEDWQVPNLPCHNMYSNDFWLGPLPSPTATEPFISLSRTSLSFMDSVTPVPSQNVTVTNTGGGTLGKVTATVAPASPWLTVTVLGSGGSPQTITNAVDPAGLAAGAHTATVTVSGGGATNSPSYTVTLNVALRIAAPSNLAASVGGVTMQDVTLNWTDNSINEDAFVVERRTGAGSWQQIAVTSANATSYTNTNVALGDYTYRVRARLGTEYSGYSNEAAVSVLGLPSATVTSPAGGATLTGGSVCYVRWTTNQISNVELLYTLDDGDHWVPFSQGGGISERDPQWGNYAWTVPDINAPSVIVRVQMYQQPAYGGNSGTFAIIPSTAAVPAAVRRLPVRDGLVTDGPIVLARAAPIRYGVRSGERAMLLRVYRADGAYVTDIALSTQTGYHTANWDGRDAAGKRVAPGAYVGRFLTVCQP